MGPFDTFLGICWPEKGDYAELNTLIIDGGHSYGACKLHFDSREGARFHPAALFGP